MKLLVASQQSLGLFIELTFCMTEVYFLNYHKQCNCSFISLFQCNFKVYAWCKEKSCLISDNTERPK